jgi:hypothetical protein
VRVTGKNATVMAIQITNLTLERRAKKSMIGNANVDRGGGSMGEGFHRHLVIACTFCDEDKRLTLVEQNMSFLQTCEGAVASLTLHNGLIGAWCAVASWARDNEWVKPILCNIIKKWREQANMGFIRFLNGNMTDCRAANLQFVSLRDALLHFEEWTVDLCINLTEDEIAFVTKPVVRQLLVHHEWHEAEDGTDATNDQCGQSSPLPVIASEREVPSARAVPTTDFVNNNSYSTKQVANVMKNFRKCKQGAVNVVLSSLRAGECNSLLLDLVFNGLIPATLGLLRQCEHEEFNEMVKKVKGNLQTPIDLIEILLNMSLFEQCKVEIANGIQAVVRCLCNDSKRLFFNSNNYWHQAAPLFAGLVSNLLFSSDDLSSKVTASTVCHILLQNEGFLESMVHRCFWTSYRPDLVKEYESHQLSDDVKTLEAFAHKVIRNIIVVGLERNKTETENELNRLAIPEAFSQDGLDLIMTIAKTLVVSKAYEPECKVNYVVGKIRMSKLVDSEDRWDQFSILNSMFAYNADCVDNGIITEVIELGSKFIADIDDAIIISDLSFCMLVRKAQGNAYPIDKRIAFAIKSGLLEMCFDFITRFACDPNTQLIARDAQRNQLMEALVYIADLIKAVVLHQNTSKAIRDRRCQTVEALNSLLTKKQSKQSTQFVDILSSVMELNEGSCSRCNKLIEWHTALFCEGCRRVTYCGVKCQKKDWKHGTHSSHCSFLARSADMMGLTLFDVKSSRNISELTGLRNNIVTSQKKLFLMHKVSLFSQLVCCSDQSDCVAVFDLSNKQRSIIVEHYHVVFACPKQRKWFEDVRSPGKIICVFVSQVFNGEFDEEGNANRIALFAIFPIPKRIQSV